MSALLQSATVAAALGAGPAGGLHPPVVSKWRNGALRSIAVSVPLDLSDTVSRDARVDEDAVVLGGFARPQAARRAST